MTEDLNNAAFRTGFADYQKLAHAFTSFYGQRAWELAGVPEGAKVLDIAAGAGALALAAAQAGAQVLAVDFSPGMVEAVRAYRLPNLSAEVMDGQALNLPDASFDAAFSLFGIMLFPDWRKGLSEMALVVRSGGVACIASWKEPAGAAANLLLADHVRRHCPEVAMPTPVEGLNEFRDPVRFGEALTRAGFENVVLHEVVHDYVVDARAVAEPDRLFQFSPIWPALGATQKRHVLDAIDAALTDRDGTLPVPSPAWIAVARRY